MTDPGEVVSPDSQTIEVRPDEQLDLSRLLPWFRDNLPLPAGDIRVRQFSGGHANLTYLLTVGETEYVLRRPPLGPVAASAHDMKREHRVLSRLWRGFRLAPRSYVYCDDKSLIGSDFHILERKHGTVVQRDNAESVLSDPAQAKAISEALVDCLADFHLADPVTLGLDDLGRPDGFLDRQITGWIKRWSAAVDDGSPDIAPLVTWLEDNKPAPRYVSLVHNDYKLDNVMFLLDGPAKPTAVLDWDMCTRGDPLTDLGTLLNYWLEASDPDFWLQTTTTPNGYPGFLSRRAAISRYAVRTGFDMSDIRWYFAFGTFRTMVILQQIYIRWLKGQTRDDRFSNFGARVRALADKALAVANGTVELGENQ